MLWWQTILLFKIWKSLILTWSSETMDCSKMRIVNMHISNIKACCVFCIDSWIEIRSPRIIWSWKYKKNDKSESQGKFFFSKNSFFSNDFCFMLTFRKSFDCQGKSFFRLNVNVFTYEQKKVEWSNRPTDSLSLSHPLTPWLHEKKTWQIEMTKTHTHTRIRILLATLE